MMESNAGSLSSTGLKLITLDSAIDMSQFERAVVTRPRPSLLINERELSVLRRGLTKEGWKRRLYLQPLDNCHGTYLGAGLLSFANKWLDVEPERRDWATDHRVDCCKWDEQFILPWDKDRRCAECMQPLGGQGFAIPAWRAQLHRLMAAAVALSVVYGIEKEKAYAEKAAQVILTCADAYAEARRTPGVSFDPKCAVGIAQAYDLIYYSRCMGEKDKEQVERHFFAPLAEELAAQSDLGTEGIWRTAALGLIGLAVRDHIVVSRCVEDVNEWLTRIGDDGLVPGSLADDHFESLAALLHLSEACYRCGINLYSLRPDPGKSIRAMFTAPLRYAYPSFRLPASGNSSFDAFLPLSLYEVAYRRWPDPDLAWVLKRGYSFVESPADNDHVQQAHRFARASFNAFFFGRDLPGRSTVMSPRSRAASSQGLASLRNHSSMMATVSYRSEEPVRHRDALSFTLYANDQLAAPDYGASEGASHSDGWHTETWAHNTVVVDGCSHPPDSYRAEVNHCLGTDFQGARFTLADCYPGVTHTRTLMMLGNVCVLSDVLESNEAHTFDWLLRCEGDPHLPDGVRIVPVPDGLHPLIETRSAVASDEALPVRWQLRSGTLDQTIWSGPGPSELIAATCPAQSLEHRVPLLICRQRGPRAEFLSVFVRAGLAEEPRVSRAGGTLVVERGTQHVYIQSKALGDRNGQAINTDGHFASVLTDCGVVQSMVLSGGSRLEWKSDLMISCPSKADCVEVSLNGSGPQIRYKGGEAGLLHLKTNARSTRVNGHRAVASNTGGVAKIRISPQMLNVDTRASI